MTEERWDPVARIVFKPTCGIEPRIQAGSSEKQTSVCVASKLLRISVGRVVSTDLVESYDLLMRTCEDCKTQLDQPSPSWWGDYHHPRCSPCNIKFEEYAKQQQKEYSEQSTRNMARRKELLAAMSPEDRELFRY